MAEGKSMWRTLAYIFIAILLVGVVLRVIAFVFNLALHLVAIFFSLLFVVALVYVVYLILRGAFAGE